MHGNTIAYKRQCADITITASRVKGREEIDKKGIFVREQDCKFLCSQSAELCHSFYWVCIFSPVCEAGLFFSFSTAFCSDKNHHPAKKKKKKDLRGVRACTDQGYGGVRGGWPLLAVMREREFITGSCVLYERDREGFTEKEVTWKRDSQSEREASQPLKSTLRLTPSYSPPFSTCKYSTSSEDSLLGVFDVIFFFYY